MKKMKITLIALGLVILVFVMVQLYAQRSRNKIESYPYVVAKEYKNFEIRNYEASLFTAVTLPTGEYDKSSNKGFSILAGYIFGGNKDNEKIAMTSPVAMSLEDSITMMFLVPRELRKDSLPTPDRSEFSFREEPAKTVAAIRFGGWASSEKIEKNKDELKAALDAEGISYTNHFYYLGYNPPFDLFNRRNEIIVELEKEFTP